MWVARKLLMQMLIVYRLIRIRARWTFTTCCATCVRCAALKRGVMRISNTPITSRSRYPDSNLCTAACEQIWNTSLGKIHPGVTVMVEFPDSHQTAFKDTKDHLLNDEEIQMFAAKYEFFNHMRGTVLDQDRGVFAH